MDQGSRALARRLMAFRILGAFKALVYLEALWACGAANKQALPQSNRTWNHHRRTHEQPQITTAEIDKTFCFTAAENRQVLTRQPA